MNDKDLIARLRWLADPVARSYEKSDRAKTENEAADRLEKLSAQNERLISRGIEGMHFEIEKLRAVRAVREVLDRETQLRRHSTGGTRLDK